MIDNFLISETSNKRTNNVCYAVIDPGEFTIGYMDLTGRFPKKFSWGNQYIMIAYHYDANHIRAIPIKN